MAALSRQTLILCGGLQSSGTTLVSYCFLQRADTDGVLDADNDLLPALDARLARPLAWYKTTISCFRLGEIAGFYRDAGWDVRTLLVLRDLRVVWASLRTKPYGRNGITAEDPPLRLRVRRFVEDWRTAARDGTVLLRYEDFIKSPELALQRTCRLLGIPWDAAMIHWPKPPVRISDHDNGNQSFWKSRHGNLIETIGQYRERSSIGRVRTADLNWLESEFRDFNAENGYPLQLPPVSEASDAEQRDLTDSPSFQVTRRYEWETKRKPIRWFLSQIGVLNTKLIDRRSWKRVA
jgi:hypothetical protein